MALTTTVNDWFGTCVVVPGTGHPAQRPDGRLRRRPGVPNAFGLVGTGVNAVAPGKRPLSSMAPTLVFDAEGRVVLAVGAPGGATIPSTVAQVIVHVLGDGMPLDQALGAPRLHHQWLPDEVLVEPFGLDAATADGAARPRPRCCASGPAPSATRRRPPSTGATGLREAASEPRFEGAPAIP